MCFTLRKILILNDYNYSLKNTSCNILNMGSLEKIHLSLSNAHNNFIKIIRLIRRLPNYCGEMAIVSAHAQACKTLRFNGFLRYVY